jgi:hypothetical protein
MGLLCLWLCEVDAVSFELYLQQEQFTIRGIGNTNVLVTQTKYYKKSVIVNPAKLFNTPVARIEAFSTAGHCHSINVFGILYSQIMDHVNLLIASSKSGIDFLNINVNCCEAKGIEWIAGLISDQKVQCVFAPEAYKEQILDFLHKKNKYLSPSSYVSLKYLD